MNGGAKRGGAIASVWDSYPDARVDLDTRAFYEGLLVRELRINRCGDCGRWHHPPRPLCPSCWSFEIVPTAVRGSGEVQLALTLEQGPAQPGVEYPYPVVAVGLDEQPGLRLTGALLDPRSPVAEIGARVGLEWILRRGAPWPAFRRSAPKGGR